MSSWIPLAAVDRPLHVRWHARRQCGRRFVVDGVDELPRLPRPRRRRPDVSPTLYDGGIVPIGKSVEPATDLPTAVVPRLDGSQDW